MIARDPVLAAAEHRFECAAADLETERSKAIVRCKHEIVFEARLLSSGSNPNGRICPRCSYEEHSWWWPTWDATNNDRKDRFQSILNTEIVVKCEPDKFYSFRT